MTDETDKTEGMVEAVMGQAKTDAQLRSEMTAKIAELTRQLAESKGAQAAIDAALAAKEVVWWQSHPDFPPEWQDLERCTLNPKMNEEKKDTPVSLFM